MRAFVGTLMLLVGLSANAQDDSVGDKIRAAMEGDVRTEADLARDRNRKPVETLEFFQLRDNMRVVELIPGGGWYTKILAPVLREDGELYVAIGTNNVRDNLTTQDGFEHINVIDIGVQSTRDGEFGTNNMAEFGLGVTGLDLAVTFRNMHNFTPAGRNNINTAVFNALGSGGLYGVIDHTRRHMQELTRENRRRADPVEIIQEVEAAGFEFVDYSDLHYRLDDQLRYEVGRATVTGNTDRFTLLFRKP